MIIVACGFDPSCYDPLARLSASFDTFGEMTRMMMDAAAELCGGKLVFVQEGGYSEEYAPLCGLKVISVLAGAELDMPEPRAAHVQSMQPTGRLLSLQLEMLDEIAAFLKL